MLFREIRQEKSGGPDLFAPRNRRFSGYYHTTEANRRIPQLEADVAKKRRFTRIPKTTELIRYVPTEVIPTYCALADYANNQSGECFPKMETLAETLNKSVRTIQRHLHLLRKQGLIEFVERRRNRGKYSSYLYRMLFF